MKRIRYLQNKMENAYRSSTITKHTLSIDHSESTKLTDWRAANQLPLKSLKQSLQLYI